MADPVALKRYVQDGLKFHTKLVSVRFRKEPTVFSENRIYAEILSCREIACALFEVSD